MQKFLLLLVGALIVASFVFTGHQIGTLVGLGFVGANVLSGWAGVFGAIATFSMFGFGADSASTRPACVSADELNPGIYEGLGFVNFKDRCFGIVIPIDDHDPSTAWSFDPILVERGSDIPQGRFEVTTARKTIRSLESPEPC